LGGQSEKARGRAGGLLPFRAVAVVGNSGGRSTGEVTAL